MHINSTRMVSIYLSIDIYIDTSMLQALIRSSVFLESLKTKTHYN